MLAILFTCGFGCDEGSRAVEPPPASHVEVVLERAAGLPRFEIQATFVAKLDPSSHIQPIAAALAHARTRCSKPDLAAHLDLEVRNKSLHAKARSASAACLAHAIDGTAIDDTDYVVELLVSVG